MAGKHNKHLSYGVEMEPDFLCGKINVNERVRRTYIDVETLANTANSHLSKPWSSLHTGINL